MTQVNELNGSDSSRLRTYDLSLEPLDVMDLPESDDPEVIENEATRGYFGAVPTIDGVTS